MNARDIAAKLYDTAVDEGYNDDFLYGYQCALNDLIEALTEQGRDLDHTYEQIGHDRARFLMSPVFVRRPQEGMSS